MAMALSSMAARREENGRGSVHRDLVPVAMAPAGFRQHPHNIEAEQALLGAILVNNEAWRRVSDFLRGEHFYEPVHARLFAAMAREIGAGRLADARMLWREFNEDEALRELDGALYLERIARAAETIINAHDYGRLIHDLAVKRGLIALAEQLANAAYDPTVPLSAAEMLAGAEREVAKLSQESAASAAKPFMPLDHEDIDLDLPQREFLVDHWIPKGCVTSLYGSGGTGKSFLAMMIGTCVAAGRTWLEYRCEQGPVLALMCEDDEEELRRRRNQIAKSLGIGRHDIGDRLALVPRVGEINALMEFPGGIATRTELFTRIIAEARRLMVKLLILDNAAQLFAGNEIDRSQVTAFLNAVAAIARELNCAVLLLGHPPKVKGSEYSGSTAWDAVVRSRLWFKRMEDADGNPEEGRYTLELVKSNYAKRFGIELATNSSGVVEYVGNLEPSAKYGRRSNDEKTLAALDDLFAERRRAIPLDDLVIECIRRGIVKEASEGTVEWRDRRRTARSHLAKHGGRVDEREGECFAIRP